MGAPFQGAGQDGPLQSQLGGLSMGRQCLGCCVSFGVAELFPFPLKLFLTPVSPANAPGGGWTALQVHRDWGWRVRCSSH